MQVAKVKFVKRHMWGKKGDEVEVSQWQADRLVKEGYAVIADGDGETKRIKASKIENKSLSAG